MSKAKQFDTRCVHEGQLPDPLYKGAVSPLYMATAYSYEGQDRYPRYFNTPNQVGLAKKIASLEGGEDALIFGSGMAAISTTLLAFLAKDDHVVLQRDLYGGTTNLIVEHFHRYGISYSFTQGLTIADFSREIRDNTKVIYVETPSNPLMKIIDLEGIVRLAKSNNLISMIDNTFASPVNQNPIVFGIDVVLHSATKYLGGHSDLLAGAAIASKAHMKRIFAVAKSLGGNLSDYTVWLLERSLKTLSLRVKAQNNNAQVLAEWLEKQHNIVRVYYPGLTSHPDHVLAKSQMNGFTGMMSFELNQRLDRTRFEKALEIIQPVVSLAGVESTITVPSITSHNSLTPKEKSVQGIGDNLIRFSVGIEAVEDLQQDLDRALKFAANEG